MRSFLKLQYKLARKAEHYLRLIGKLRPKIYTIFLSPLFYSIGSHVTISPPFRYANLSQVELGHHVVIHRDAWVQAVGSHEADRSPRLILKDNVSIGMGATISAAKKIIFEEGVFTARNIYVSDHGHAFRDVSIPIKSQGIGDIAEVKIGKDSWLGQNCVILPGVTIGRHCVIGANSVVNRDIPDYAVAAGAPAQIIRIHNQATGAWELSR
jgi:acetyltransferase-like isoleucine patch superfamily enzyme